MPNYMCYFGGGGAGGGNCYMKTGTYVGDGTDGRDIDIGVNLAAKSEIYLIIKGNYNKVAIHRIEYGQGDLCMVYDANVDYVNNVQALTTTGFNVGSSSSVNTAGYTYRWIALWVD